MFYDLHPGSLTVRPWKFTFPRGKKDPLPFPPFFRGELLNFRGVKVNPWRIMPVSKRWITMVIVFVPNSWCCGTSSKWPNFMAADTWGAHPDHHKADTWEPDPPYSKDHPRPRPHPPEARTLRASFRQAMSLAEAWQNAIGTSHLPGLLTNTFFLGGWIFLWQNH